jgi:hypothetical protein
MEGVFSIEAIRYYIDEGLNIHIQDEEWSKENIDEDYKYYDDHNPRGPTFARGYHSFGSSK